MKKKLLIILAIFCIAGFANVHAVGIGAQINYSAGGINAPGFSALLSPSRDVHLAANWYLPFNDEAGIIGITADYAPISIGAGLRFTLGIGVFTNLVFDNNIGVTGGIRFPVGLSWQVRRNLEIFAHIAPSFGVEFLPSLDFSKLFYPSAIGARFWLR
ncbi:MAG: DUF3996 domain-containing protein [Treponema sp.]|nr:DUF3996 domain-containing protein [Treponema sp.]